MTSEGCQGPFQERLLPSGFCAMLIFSGEVMQISKSAMSCQGTGSGMSLPVCRGTGSGMSLSVCRGTGSGMVQKTTMSC